MDDRHEEVSGRQPSAAAAWAVAVALAIVWSALRWWLSRETPSPLTFVVPLLAAVWTRHRPSLWFMAVAFAAVHTVHVFVLLPPGVLPVDARWLVWATTLGNIFVGAIVVDAIVRLRDRLEAAVDAARVAEDHVRQQSEKLQVQSEELAQQNAELSEQSEELAQQNEELQTQSEEIHALNDDLAKRQALLATMLDAARLDVGEAAALERLCGSAIRLFTDVLAVIVYERTADALTVRSVAPASMADRALAALPAGTSFAGLVLREGRTASLPDTSLRPDLDVMTISGKRVGSALCAPVSIDEMSAGVIGVYVGQPRDWTEDEFRLIEWLAHQCAVVLATLRLQGTLARRAALIDLSPDAIMVRHRDGTIIDWSRGAEVMYGYAAAEAVGRRVQDLLATRYPAPPDAIVNELERTGRWTGELVHRAKDGREVVVESRWLHEDQRDGQGGEVLESNVDVTAMRLAERRKSEFLATLSHELRNPLAAMRYALELLRRGGATPAARPLGVIERQLSHLVRLVDDLLDITRVGNNKFQLRRQRVELGAIVQQAVDAVLPEIGRQRHSLSVSVPESPVALDGDADRLAQVIINLLTNAVRYTPAGGEIRVAASASGGEVVISVTDTGIGLEADAVPRVFDMFTQFAAQGQGGLGIGLALVKAIVDLHGGTVAAFSDGPGRGAAFTVRLPLGVPLPSPEAPAAPVSRVTPQRILVVEDNSDVADMIGTALELDGHVVRVTRHADGAFEVLEGFTPDIALLDIGLPGVDGYELARRLRADPRTHAAYLVAITGWGQDGDRLRARDAGFDAHLTKPVDFGEVGRIIAVAEARHGADLPRSAPAPH